MMSRRFLSLFFIASMTVFKQGDCVGFFVDKPSQDAVSHEFVMEKKSLDVSDLQSFLAPIFLTKDTPNELLLDGSILANSLFFDSLDSIFIKNQNGNLNLLGDKNSKICVLSTNRADHYIDVPTIIANDLILQNDSESFSKVTIDAPIFEIAHFGPCKLIKDGRGAFVLRGENSYSGSTEILDGMLEICEDKNLGLAPLNETKSSIVFGEKNPCLRVCSKDRYITLDKNRGIFLKGPALIDIAQGTVAYEGKIEGKQALSKIGDGTLELKGENSFDSVLNVLEGSVVLSNPDGLSINADILIDGGIVECRQDQQINPFKKIEIVSGELNLNSSEQALNQLSISKGSVKGDGVLVLNNIDTSLILGGGSRVDCPLEIENQGKIVFDSSLKPGEVAKISSTVDLKDQSIELIILKDPQVDVSELAIDGSLIGETEVVKKGQGRLELNNLEHFQGKVKIKEGDVVVNSKEGFVNFDPFVIEGGTLAIGKNSFIDPKSVLHLETGAISIGTNNQTVESVSLSSATILGEGALSIINHENALNLKSAANVDCDVVLENGGSIVFSSKQSDLTGATISGNIEITKSTAFIIDKEQNSDNDLVIKGKIQQKDLVENCSIIKKGPGTLDLQSNNQYAGDTIVEEGVLRLSQEGRLPTSTQVVLLADNTILDLNLLNGSQKIKDLQGVENSKVLLGSNCLHIDSETQHGVFFGQIEGRGDFIKEGSGSYTLSGSKANHLQGNIEVRSGRLILDKENGYATHGNLVANGGELIVKSDRQTYGPSSLIVRKGYLHLENIEQKSNQLIIGPGQCDGKAVLILTNPNQALILGGYGNVCNRIILENGGDIVFDETINSGGNALIQSDVYINRPVQKIFVGDDAKSSKELIISGDIFSQQGDVSLIKDGPGNLEISGHLGFDGTLRIDQGVCIFNNLKSDVFHGRVVINNGSLECVKDNQLQHLKELTILSGSLNLKNKNDFIDQITIKSGSIKSKGTLHLNNPDVALIIGSDALIQSNLVLENNGSIELDDKIDAVSSTISGKISPKHSIQIIDVSNPQSTLTLTGEISNQDAKSLVLEKEGAGTLIFAGKNTHKCSVVVNDGVVKVQDRAALNQNAFINLANEHTVFDISDSSKSQKIASLNGVENSFIFLGNNELEIQSDQSHSEFNGSVLGSGSVKKSGDSELILSGVNFYTGPTIIQGGSVCIFQDENLGQMPFFDASDLDEVFQINAPRHAKYTQTLGKDYDLFYREYVKAYGHSYNLDTLDYPIVFTKDIQLDGGALKIAKDCTLSKKRGIYLGNDNGTIDVVSGSILDYSGYITGEGSFVKKGEGLFRFGGFSGYLGTTTIQGGTLQLIDKSSLPHKTHLILEPSDFGHTTLDLSLCTLAQTIQGLSAFASTNCPIVKLGKEPLTIYSNENTTFEGVIEGSARVVKDGPKTLIFSGLTPNTYQGVTTIKNGTLVVDKGTFTNPEIALNGDVEILGGTLLFNNHNQIHKDQSVFIQNGVLDLNGFNQTLNNVDLSNGKILGDSSTLVIDGQNSYFSFDSNSNVKCNLILNNGTPIYFKANDKQDKVLKFLGNIELSNQNHIFDIHTNDSSFVGSHLIIDGSILGNGGLRKTSIGTLELKGQNSYQGETIVDEGILKLSSSSVGFETGPCGKNAIVQLLDGAVLDVEGQTVVFNRLDGNSKSSLELNGSSIHIKGQDSVFDGKIIDKRIQNQDLLDKNNKIVIHPNSSWSLSNPDNNYSGLTIVFGSLNVVGDGNVSENTDLFILDNAILDFTHHNRSFDAIDLKSLFIDEGTVVLKNPISTKSYFQNAGSLKLLLDENRKDLPFMHFPSSTDVKMVNAKIEIETASLKNCNLEDHIYTLFQTDEGKIEPNFECVLVDNESLKPHFIHSGNLLQMFLGTTSSIWAKNSDCIWSDCANWKGQIPGKVGNVNDQVIFKSCDKNNLTISLKQDEKTTALHHPTLTHILFDSSHTQYKIENENHDNGLIIDGIVNRIDVLNGSHHINVPIYLKKDTTVSIRDKATFTLGLNAKIIADDATVQFDIQDAKFVNEGQICLKSLEISSGSFEHAINASLKDVEKICFVSADKPLFIKNDSKLLAVGLADAINIESNSELYFENKSSTSEVFAQKGDIFIGGSGKLFLQNGQKEMHVANNAKIATAENGHIFIQGAKVSDSLQKDGLNQTSTIIENHSKIFTGSNGNLTIENATIENHNFAELYAGDFGVLKVNSSYIKNEKSALIGSKRSTVHFVSGTIVNDGSIIAKDYIQSSSANLVMEISNPENIPTISAQRSLILNGNLTIDLKDPSLFKTQKAIKLFDGKMTRNGAFENVSFLNVPKYWKPELKYLENEVLLDFGVPEFIDQKYLLPKAAINTVIVNNLNLTNLRIQNQIDTLKMRFSKKSQNNQTISQLNTNILEKQSENVAKIQDNSLDPFRLYFAQTASFGKVDAQKNYLGLGTYSVGAVLGLDYAFDRLGWGIYTDYNYFSSDFSLNLGDAKMHQIHASLYTTFLPKGLDDLSINAILGWGYNFQKTKRDIQSTQQNITLYSSPNSNLLDVLVGAQYEIYSSKKANVEFTFTPEANLQYMYLNTDAFHEGNDTIYDVTYDKNTYQSLRSLLGFGFKLDYISKNIRFRPEMKMAWQYEFLQNTIPNATSINTLYTSINPNANFSIGFSTVLGSINLFTTLYNTYEIELNYHVQYNEEFIDQGFYLGVGFDF